MSTCCVLEKEHFECVFCIVKSFLFIEQNLKCELWWEEFVVMTP